MFNDTVREGPKSMIPGDEIPNGQGFNKGRFGRRVTRDPAIRALPCGARLVYVGLVESSYHKCLPGLILGTMGALADECGLSDRAFLGHIDTIERHGLGRFCRRHGGALLSRELKLDTKPFPIKVYLGVVKLLGTVAPMSINAFVISTLQAHMAKVGDNRPIPISEPLSEPIPIPLSTPLLPSSPFFKPSTTTQPKPTVDLSAKIAPPDVVVDGVLVAPLITPRATAVALSPIAETVRQSVSKPTELPSPLARVEALCFTQGYGPLAPKWYPKIKQLGEITEIELDYARRKVDDIVRQENRTRGNPGLLVDILMKERIAGKPQGKPWLAVNNAPVKRLHPIVTAEQPASPEQLAKNAKAAQIVLKQLAAKMSR